MDLLHRSVRCKIVGFGCLGKVCAEAVLIEGSLTLAGIVRRSERVMEPLSTSFQKIPSAAHPSKLGKVDVALLCVPTEEVFGKAHKLIQYGIPIVE